MNRTSWALKIDINLIYMYLLLLLTKANTIKPIYEAYNEAEIKY